MAIRRPWLALVILLSPAAAYAHDHFADACVAPTYEKGSTLLGFHIAGGFTVPEPPSAKAEVKRVSVLADFSMHWNKGGIDKSRTNYAGGLRYAFALRPDQKIVPFAQVLLGASHINTEGDGNTDPFVGFGVGVERIWGGPGGYGLRGQLDYLVRSGEVSPRVSVGFVFRFETHQ
jgi:hypothetical protein